MRSHLIGWLLLCISCSSPSSKTSVDKQITSDSISYVWTKVLDTAVWRKNYNFQLFSLRDTLWSFHPDGNWYSVDEGRNWSKSTLSNSIRNLAFLDYVIFKNAVYGLGYFKGNIENFVFEPHIYRSTDMKTWDTLSHNADLPKRFFYHPFVFRNKLWIIGGEDKQQQYADVWNSEDGIHWVKQKDNLPFGKRSGSVVVQVNDQLYLLNNDVWTSADGLNWIKKADAIVPGEQIFGYAAMVYDEKIWLLGCNRNGQFSSQVLVSTDGKKWEGMNAPWSPRGGIAATVHHDQIFMTGGKYGGTPDHTEFIYSNDLWVLNKKNK